MPRRRPRIISGAKGGLPLTVPAGIRPTTDRVREAVFSSLGESVRGAAVLDLYAGTGAFAAEALSRGARLVVVVDAERAAAEAAATNLAPFEQTAAEPRWRVQQTTVARFLGRSAPREAPFDVVFLDPPYETPTSEVGEALAGLAGAGWLTANARVVVERPTRAELLVPPPRLVARWERRYGDTLVTVLGP